ncbi:FmdB family zinc ribbon protein [Parahaliea mediterranea]|uniref:Zinc ribbon domain-containing protein n=1 Tax=Parahaliea mediterranea TaxID=651086 RepID=A0A939DHX4_9GAMM|nr:zinc ribbon domain-containing protein [Parahaliea mediterranea]MBN7798563.1 zinc ribbon domain-containing protein [Parahaliea mediterranea]
MPIYEYQCQACGELHEALQKISDDPLLDCPACGEPQLKKKVSAAAFRLKGGGWYETDFKTGSKKNLAGGQEGGDGKSKDSGASKAEAKKSSGGESKSSNPA